MILVQTLEETCQHIKDLIKHMNTIEVKIDACGCCNSPWIICTKCGIQIDNIDKFYSIELQDA